ncbi:hypothetical protein DMB66_13115 [Actinoplanes sp. ATCC 53533]|uniref:hypothetical protein n=1 Tax=Actinoplanes sp. ATCC 53533 TaxID=1288362 RepID=UPI000F78CDAB|nr:hypothetical protein [Actinoplanes sp. ATCC 53533]RSM68428.1 hypothetical protein DMB66_13115 [Actinoplanes sp. ATCC 53533]
MRHLTRIGSAALLAAGAVTITATPALAAEVDFGVDLRSITGLGVTVVEATITNHGTTTPDKLTLALDTSTIDESRVTIIGPAGCPASGAVLECKDLGKNDGLPKPGKSASVRAVFWRPAGAAPGTVGELTATVTVETDSEAANNSKRIPVVTPTDRSPALNVSAETVSQLEDLTSSGGVSTTGDYAEQYNGKPIPPGGKSQAFGEIYNYGAVTTTSVRTVGKLPEGVRFITDGLANCEFSADKRSATCVWDDARMGPFIFDPEIDKNDSSYRIAMPIVVDKDAKGPADLTGGEWTVAAVTTAEPKLDERAREAAQSNAASLARGQEFTTDENVAFAVRVGAAVTGGGSGNGGGTGGGSDDPSLPITGPTTATVLGTGAALVALGVFLAYASRRRKTV